MGYDSGSCGLWLVSGGFCCGVVVVVSGFCGSGDGFG